jgi:DNA-binding response OmpR family regulator
VEVGISADSKRYYIAYSKKGYSSVMEIFLVEDDEIYAEFIRKALLSQNAEWKIRHFATAEEAETAINGRLPEVLIIDYKLPGISGIDLYDRIKHKVKEANKVIMLSALDDGQMVLGFIQKGVRDYVIKDENVIDSLKAILDGKEDDYYLFN